MPYGEHSVMGGTLLPDHFHSANILKNWYSSVEGAAFGNSWHTWPTMMFKFTPPRKPIMFEYTPRRFAQILAARTHTLKFSKLRNGAGGRSRETNRQRTGVKATGLNPGTTTPNRAPAQRMSTDSSILSNAHSAKRMPQRDRATEQRLTVRVKPR